MQDEERKRFISRHTRHILFTILWNQTFGKWPIRQLAMKSAANTSWTTLSN